MGRPAALIACAALLAGAELGAVTAQEGQAPGSARAQAESPPRPPGRRRALDGLAGFVSRSKLVYPSAPDTPYRLEATYVFPERARWLLHPWAPEAPAGEAEAPDRRSRSLRFRFGGGAWAVDPGQVASRAFADEELRLTRLQLELRRVATVWPAEHEWVADGDTRTVELEGLGALVAELGPDGRPLSLASRDPDGTARERLAAIRWAEPEREGARRWPASWDFHYAGRLVWHETFESLVPTGKVSELFFLPPDRRGAGGAVALPPGSLQRLELPPAAAWGRDLAAESRAWPRALEQARADHARWSKALGADLAPRPVFLLDAEARPRRLELRLVAVPEELPDGWSLRPAGVGLRRILTGLDGVTAAAVRDLGGALEEGERAGPAYLEVQLTPSGVGLTQLIVPVLEVD